MWTIIGNHDVRLCSRIVHAIYALLIPVVREHRWRSLRSRLIASFIHFRLFPLNVSDSSFGLPNLPLVDTTVSCHFHSNICFHWTEKNRANARFGDVSFPTGFRNMVIHRWYPWLVLLHSFPHFKPNSTPEATSSFYPFVGNTECIRIQHNGSVNVANRTGVSPSPLTLNTSWFHPSKAFVLCACAFDLLCLIIVGIVRSFFQA